MEKIRLVLEPNYSEIRIARKEFRDASKRNNISDEDESDVEIVIGELLANAIDHGMAGGEFSPIYFYMEISHKEIYLEMRYKGEGVTNEEISGYAELNEVENIEDLSDHGRGLFIMYNIMNSVDYSYDNGIAKVVLIKNIK